MRLPFIDALKAIASQLIVLHHLAFYGPMSDRAETLAPALFGWLAEHARIAVQVFLVVGGFLAARTLAPTGTLATTDPLAAIARRYRKLALPYLAALLLAIAGTALAGRWMTHDSLSAPPQLGQLLAHALLLHDLLDHEALSAGVWYVAIDFQLFILFVLLLQLGRGIGRSPTPGIVLVAGLSLLSLFHFNRDAAWDDWGLYFFGAYGLGALAYWAGASDRALRWALLIGMVAGAALLTDFRSRLALALVIALALLIARRSALLGQWPRQRPLAWLGRISYAVFLVHFPVCLVVNAAFVRFAPDDAGVQALGVLLAWVASVLAGDLFHRHVETRIDGWGLRLAALLWRPVRNG